MKGLLLILWFLISYSKLQNAKANSTVTRTPQLWLEKAGVTPTSEISAGDAITMLVDISHTMKSFADAIDVELSVSCPPYIMFGSNDTRSLSSHNITKHQNAQFSNITLGTGVKVSMTTHVDPYKMLGSREKVTAMCTMTLWYYGAVDSCHRPGSKWNARSTSVDISFSFTSLAACEMEIQLYESYFSASSFRKLSYSTLGNAPHRANFDNDLVWTPSDTKDIHQYLQIELNHLMRITKVGTKGNGQQSSPRFVRKFVLHYSKDGREWAKAYAAFQSHEFTANNDPTTVKINVLKIPIEAKVIRIVPKLWKYEIALKVQLFGCLVSSLSAGYQPLGMSSGAIKDNKITAAPWKGLTYRPYHARLDFKEAWCTTKNWKQTLTIDLQDNYVIAEIAVQSKYQTTDRLYEAFKVSYEKNGGTKEYIRENGGVKSFLGSPIEDTTIRHKFLEPILARHVHIEPKLIANTVCLRLELYGFKEGEDFLSDHCTIFDFEDDYSLTQWKKTGTAFDNQPTFLDNLHARTGLTVNHEGARWIGTRENRKNPRDIPGDIQGNSPTGTLTSPPFIIPASKLYFLFAGSADQEKSRVELLIEGRVERTSFSATGNESMAQMSWNVRDLLGEKAQIRLVDSGSDAFVSFDGLKSSCHVPKESLPVFERSFS
ncbi:uncharacterized protein LOC114532356 isoform X2 [Dendronephthya gigantea]|uniref:uncharacterized protein LOC114532356 isoform X2 n=1 Tax=Dendronephthya gigantea TaxID=151771 RepID=UPI0010697DF6|nr:uncharacterized protein LOC114532356 isoform X2 [Dendronephthya gigantea]